MTVADLRPIETLYRGYRFRSRLEARWAVFFQTLGMRWEYEPEGFKLSTGEWYLPDFRVWFVNEPWWCEVKPPGGDVTLFEQFMEDIPAHGAVLREIPDPNDPQDWFPEQGYFETDSDCFYQFCICLHCGAVGFEFEGRSDRMPCCGDPAKQGRGHTFDHPRILAAYAAARAARFEHGETPP